MALKTLKGKVEEIQFKVSKTDNEYCIISFTEERRPGNPPTYNDWPYNCRTFDEDLVEDLKILFEEDANGLKNQVGYLRVEVKQDREYQGKPVTDRDIVDYDFSGTMEWTRTQGQEDQVQPQAAPPTAGVPQSGNSDPRQASIERQVAFKEAVSIVARMNPTAETGWWDSIFLATNIGESILNRTYGHENLAEKLNEWIKLIGAYTPSTVVKEPDLDDADQNELFTTNA